MATIDENPLTEDVSVDFALAPYAADLPAPHYASALAAGCDLYAAIAANAPVTIAPGAMAALDTGLMIALPPGWEAQVRPRSGLALKHSLTIMNSPGTVDADYRGLIIILLANLGAAPFTVTRGMRIAQMVVARAPRARFRRVETLPDTARGAGGFGSTGLSTTGLSTTGLETINATPAKATPNVVVGADAGLPDVPAIAKLVVDHLDWTTTSQETAASVVAAALKDRGFADARAISLSPRRESLTASTIFATAARDVAVVVTFDAKSTMPRIETSSRAEFEAHHDGVISDPLLEATLAAYQRTSHLIHHGAGKPWADASWTTRAMWIDAIGAAVAALTAGRRREQANLPAAASG